MILDQFHTNLIECLLFVSRCCMIGFNGSCCEYPIDIIDFETLNLIEDKISSKSPPSSYHPSQNNQNQEKSIFCSWLPFVCSFLGWWLTIISSCIIVQNAVHTQLERLSCISSYLSFILQHRFWCEKIGCGLFIYIHVAVFVLSRG